MFPVPGTHALHGVDQDEDLGPAYDHRVIGRLAVYVRPHWRRLLVVLLVVMVGMGAAVAVPWLVKLAIDGYIRGGDVSGLDLILLVFVLIAFVRAGSHFISQRLLLHVSLRLIYTLTVALFTHLQMLSMAYFDRNEAGRIMSRVQDDVQQIQGTVPVLIRTLTDAATLLAVIGAMFWMSPLLALITLSVIPPLLVFLIAWHRYSKKYYRRNREATALLFSRVQETVTGIRVIQAFSREERSLNGLSRANDDFRDSWLILHRFSGAAAPVPELIGAAGLALLIAFGGQMAIQGSVEVGVLVAFALYIERFFEPLRNLTQNFISMQMAWLPAVVSSTSSIKSPRSWISRTPRCCPRSRAKYVSKVWASTTYRGHRSSRTSIFR